MSTETTLLLRAVMAHSDTSFLTTIGNHPIDATDDGPSRVFLVERSQVVGLSSRTRGPESTRSRKGLTGQCFVSRIVIR